MLPKLCHLDNDLVIIIIIIILWVTTQTQLFYFLKTKKKKPGAGEWPKLFRENIVEKTRFVCTPFFAQKVANPPDGLLNDFRLPRRPLIVRAALL